MNLCMIATPDKMNLTKSILDGSSRVRCAISKMLLDGSISLHGWQVIARTRSGKLSGGLSAEALSR